VVEKLMTKSRLSLPVANIASIEAVMNAPTSLFGELVQIASLDPVKDFRFADLSGTDFSNTDLRGFDFTGADLTAAMGVDVTWDHTTILIDADIAGSIFVRDAAVTPSKSEGR
jgi:hypothetical protein